MNLKNQNQKIKINSGIYKGQSLALPSNQDLTRPSKSIVRDACMNSLRQDLPYSVFIECFAGSGSVGIQALSEKACFAVFLEQEKQVLATLKNNLATLNIENSRTFLADSFIFLPSLLNFLKQFNQNLIFYLDPPFNIRLNQHNIYDKLRIFIEKLPKSKIIIEHNTKYHFSNQIGKFKKFKTKKFGKTSLTYFI